ncbi:MAG: DUF1080 domain-containing protein [Planctomycetes bacterium]|nr:DUF1080 domain-containing protein [Planctomycetota bacterium]
MSTYRLAMGLMVLAAAVFGAAWAAEGPKGLGYQDTPMIPGVGGQQWHVHDGLRPQPRIVTPGAFSTEQAPGQPPSDAIILFDGKDLSKWQDSKGNPCGWKVANGYMECPPAKTPGGGEAVTKDQFGDVQLHLEFCEPTPPKGDSQGRGNSGVFLAGRYEIQVLDGYENPTYADGACASLYGQYPPLVNACRKPGEWQVYDILWTAPRFKDGKLESPAYVTMFHNGVLMHNHAALMGGSGHKTLPKYTPHDAKGPIKLQDHGNPIRYRNIWVRELKAYDQP